jgi:O-palmitoleoyl-L-serine hydrolase
MELYQGITFKVKTKPFECFPFFIFFFLIASSNQADSSKWVIHLQGGGECVSKDSCYSELNSNLGSSKYFDKTMQMGFFCNDNPSENKDWATSNHVHIPYCSGDLHSGTRTVANDDSYGLYFTGHYVFEAVINDLLANYQLSNATDVILSGDSAGGIGVWMNIDYLQERLIAINPTIRVVGAPIAGFYFYAELPYTGPDHTSSSLANFSEVGIQEAYYLWQSYVDQTCLLAKTTTNDPYACIFSAYSFPYISTDTFVIEAQTDQVVLELHDWIPNAPTLCNNPELQYIAHWKNEMLQFFRGYQLINDTSNTSHHGAFLPACYTHTGFSATSPLITYQNQSYNYYEAFGNWYYHRSIAYQLYDLCALIPDPSTINAKNSIFCNPSCYSPC